MTDASRFAAPDVEVAPLPGGGVRVRSRVPLGPADPTVLHWLRDWAAATPGTPLLTVAADADRRPWSYEHAWTDVQRGAAALIARGLRSGDRVAVIAPNSPEHLTAGLATMLAGGIYVPMAPQYVAPDGDPTRIQGVLALLEPRFAWVPDEATAVRLREIGRFAGDVIVGAGSLAGPVGAAPSPDAIDPALPAKILLTSGSTGRPKPVAYTQTMMTTNLQMTVAVWPFLLRHRPVLVDWLPWNHAFGGNANVHLVLSQGGTLHVDESGGRPERLAVTTANLRRLRPTFHGAVPAGYAALLPELERDVALREAFFGRLDVMFSAGASMHPLVYRRLSELSATVRGEAVPILTGWGATECGPGATMVHAAGVEPDCIGTPLPGVDLRLEPVGDKHELLVRGPCVATGYWRQPERTATAFTADGYYRTGDAGAFVDPRFPERGLRFAGRIADDFKLANGTWVDVTGLRHRLLTAAGGGLRDLLVIGADRPQLAVLAWAQPHFDAADLSALLHRHNTTFDRSSTRIAAGALLDPPPAGDELSAKGQLVRSAVLTRRTALVDRLYAMEGAR